MRKKITMVVSGTEANLRELVEELQQHPAFKVQGWSWDATETNGRPKPFILQGRRRERASTYNKWKHHDKAVWKTSPNGTMVLDVDESVAKLGMTREQFLSQGWPRGSFQAALQFSAFAQRPR